MNNHFFLKILLNIINKMISKKRPLLIDPGILDLQELYKIVEGKEDVYIISQDVVYNGQSLEQLNRLNGIFDKQLLPTYPMGGQFQHDEIFFESDTIIGKIIDDHQTFQLYDRCNRFFFKSTSLKIAEILPKIEKSIYWLNAINPARIVFMATPHHIDTWIFSRVAEELGIIVNYFDESILPWRYFLFSGLSNARILEVNYESYCSIDKHSYIIELLNKKRGDEKVALPPYVLEMRKKNGNKIYSLYRDLLNNYKRPDLVINKYLCYRSLKKKQVVFKNGRYAIFFMHYQPERTTLPEGYGYSQQLRAISQLRKALPKDVFLYVKEHPSTFTDFLDWRERTPSFYSYFDDIENCGLLPIDFSAYDLIDDAFCVSTIKGLVAHEAYIRGVPVVVFSDLWLPKSDLKYVHIYKSIKNLVSFFQELPKVEKASIRESSEIYIDQIMKFTFVGPMERSSNITDNDYFKLQREGAILSGIRAIVSEFIK
jgi:hypothetical protein